MAALMASELYPIVHRFLVESGLSRTLKAFDKETAVGDDAETVTRTKRSKKLSKSSLLSVCQHWLESGVVAKEPKVEDASKEPEVEDESLRPKKRKRVAEEEVPAAETPTPVAETAVVKASEEATAVPAEVHETKKKQKKEKEVKEANSGVPFKRVDDEKWKAAIKDSRLLDNTHKAKNKFGGSAGDSWGDSAAVDMLKVKGKGFRKEMAKKKRASWRGCGELDQGVNSIKFEDSDDE
jgi:hypothetical protein